MTAPVNPADETAVADEQTVRIAAWLERELGVVRRIERQARWRPAWFADVESDGRLLNLYIRGARAGLGSMSPLAQEAGVFQILEKHGIPVPHVHGMIEDPEAIVMDCLAGRPDLSTVDDEVEKRAILLDYMEILSRAHAIDPHEFEAAGLAVPATAEDVTLGKFKVFEDVYRKAKRRPEPLLEFAIRWVHRNLPEAVTFPTFLTCDSGQFMFDGGRVSGVIDLEFAYVGDPAHDLAGLRIRDMSEPLGNIGAGLRHYEELTGKPLDVARIDFHTVQWVLCTPMSMILVMHWTPPMTELVQYFEWFNQYSLIAVEGIANILGVDLPEVSLPEPVRHRHSGVFSALPKVIGSLAAGDAANQFERDSTAKIATYLKLLDRFDAAIESANLDDVAALLGHRPVDWAAADAALEEFVVTAGPEHDADLVRLFHRRAMRAMLLMEPILSGPGRIGHLESLPSLLARAN